MTFPESIERFLTNLVAFAKNKTDDQHAALVSQLQSLRSNDWNEELILGFVHNNVHATWWVDDPLKHAVWMRTTALNAMVQFGCFEEITT